MWFIDHFGKQKKGDISLSFYKNKLIKISIQNERSPYYMGGIFIDEADLLNTFGEPNIEKKYNIDDVTKGIDENLAEGDIHKKVNKLKWKSPSDIEVSYNYTTQNMVMVSSKDGDKKFENQSFIYIVIDLNKWKNYDNERALIIDSKEQENKKRFKQEDSLRVRNAQNNI